MAFSVAETLPQVKGFAGDSGTCSDATALKYLNFGRALVWPFVNSPFTTGYLCIRCVNECVTLPSEVSRVCLAWYGNTPVSLGSEWYSSIPQVGFPTANSCHQKFTQIGQQVVTFQNYQYPYQIALQAESPADVGKILTVGGNDQYGTYHKEDITLSMTPQYALGNLVFKDVRTIVKPRTRGRVRLYAYDQQRDVRFLQAVYQPYDVNPFFLQYSSSRCNKTLTILAKKKFYDLVDMNELVEFSPHAMMHAMNAQVSLENKGDGAKYRENLEMAVNRVNAEATDRETDTGSPMRIFVPDVSHALIGDTGWGNGYSNGFSGFGNSW